MICISGIHVVLAVTAPPPPTVQKNDSGYIKVIRGLHMLGRRYDVNFAYQQSFDQVFSAGEPPARDALPFYEEGEDGAAAATFAIGEALNIQEVMNDGERFNMLYVPYKATETSTSAMGVHVRAAGADAGSNVWLSFEIKREFSRSVKHLSSDAWATFRISEDSEDDRR